MRFPRGPFGRVALSLLALALPFALPGCGKDAADVARGTPGTKTLASVPADFGKLVPADAFAVVYAPSIAGLEKPTSGRVLVDGKDVTGFDVRRRSVAMVYQQFINYPTLSVYENIASPLRVQGVARGEIESRVREAAKLLKLEPYLDRTPLQLSAGQQQRTAIARALVKRADLVLLDEPLANLDYKLREELREELPRVFAASGAIFVYATTEPSEALLLGGNTATLFEGRVTQFGPTPQVYRKPHNLVTARVFSDPPLNMLTIRKSGGMASLNSAVSVSVN